MRKNQDPSEQEITTWQALWYRKIVPFYQGKWLTGVIGFNRISLMVGLMSPVEDNKLLDILPKDSITRKVRSGRQRLLLIQIVIRVGSLPVSN